MKYDFFENRKYRRLAELSPSGDNNIALQEREKRRYRRFHARDGVIAYWRDSYGKVVDIGLGGVSFCYTGGNHNPFLALTERHRPYDKLELIFGRNNLYLPDIEVRVVFDRRLVIDEENVRLIGDHICGLSFGRMTNDQFFLLKSFILTGTDIGD